MNKITIDLDTSVSNIIENVDLTKKIESIVHLALKEENIDVPHVFVSIAAVSSDKIREINNKYRNIDNSTDVLSFPIFEKYELENISKLENGKKPKEIELGDIILCIDVIKEHAKEYGTGIYREVLYMITHATFHLLGYDHMVDDEKKVMREKEEKILSKIGEI